MTGVITALVQARPENPYFTWGIVSADADAYPVYDYTDPRWITAQPPRDGRFKFWGFGFPTLCVGQHVSFDPQPGSILPGGTFETYSTCANVVPA